MNKFEKLVEYIVNDEVDKARELFHDIVCDKSRKIYEDLMSADDLYEADEVEADEESDEDFGDSDEDFDSEESEEDFDDEDDSFGDEDAADGSFEDQVLDLKDQLDELMAEFEALMSDDDAEMDDDFGDEDFGDDSMGDEEFGDELEMDDTEEFGDELAEGIELTPAPKPVTGEESFVNKRSINADNTGAIGSVAKPVSMTGDTAQGRSAPKVGDLPDSGKFRNVPAKDNSKLETAPKPVTSQAAGVNNTTPFPKV